LAIGNERSGYTVERRKLMVPNFWHVIHVWFQSAQFNGSPQRVGSIPRMNFCD